MTRTHSQHHLSIALRIDDPLDSRLRRYAADHDQPLSRIIRRALRQYLDDPDCRCCQQPTAGGAIDAQRRRRLQPAGEDALRQYLERFDATRGRR